jgi:hypothetical protein
MPSAQEVYDQLIYANNRLGGDPTGTNPADSVNGHLGTLEGLVNQVNDTLVDGFGELVAIGNYTNEALYDITEQNETIICNLEKITKQTCQLVNEAHAQTQLQTSIERSTTRLVDMFSTVHADAALDLERREELNRKIEECCPPKPRPPVCVYEPCEKPERIEEPPKVKRTDEKKQPEEPK